MLEIKSEKMATALRWLAFITVAALLLSIVAFVILGINLMTLDVIGDATGWFEIGIDSCS